MFSASQAHTRGKTLICVVAVILTMLITTPSRICALDIVVNGDLHTSLDTAWFEANGIERESFRIVTLIEALPLVVSCSAVTVKTGRPSADGANTDIGAAGSEAGSWVRLGIEDLFSAGYLVHDGSRVVLEWQGTRIDDVVGIELQADLLESDSLTAWVSWEGIPELKQEITRFADLHGIKIDVVDTPNIRTKLITVLRARGRVPDMMMVQSDYIPELTESQALQPVDPANFPHLLPKSVEAMSLNGSFWAVPFYCDTQLVFINPEIIDPPEPDWTLDEMEALAESANRQGLIPMSWNAYSAYWLVPFQMAFGKDRLIEPEGFITVDDEPTREAVRYLVELKDRGLLRLLERNAMTTLFAEGRVAMILSGSYAIPGFTRIGIPFAVVPFPLLGDREDRNSSSASVDTARSGGRDALSPDRAVSPFLDFKGFAVTRRARNPILARRLIQYLTGLEVQYRFTQIVTKLPVTREAMLETRHAGTQTNSLPDTLITSYNRGIPVPAHPAYGHFKNTMWKLLRLALADEAMIDAVLEKGQIIIEGRDER